MGDITVLCKGDFDFSGSFATDLVAYLNVPSNVVTIQQGAAPDGSPLTSEVSLQLRNTSGIFSPRNGASAIYGPKSRVPVRIQGTHTLSGVTTTYDLWKGYIRNQRWTFLPGTIRGRYNIQCRDLLALILPLTVNVDASTSDDTDGAVGATLTAAGLSGGDYDVSADSPQPLASFHATERTVSDILGDLIQTEMGGLTPVIISDPNGKPTFIPRSAWLGVTLDSSPPPNVWGEGTTIIPYESEEEERDDDLITKVEVSITKETVGAAGTTGEVVVYDAGYVFETGRTLTLTPGQVVGPFRLIPNQVGVSAIFGTPKCIPGVDYQAGTTETLFDVNATALVNVVLTPVPGLSYHYDVAIRNTSSSNTYYLGKLQVRSVAITDASGVISAVKTGDTPTGTDDATIGNQAWTSPASINADDGSFATVALNPAGNDDSHYLVAKNFTMGIPSNATIQGIMPEASLKSSAGSATNMSCRIIREDKTGTAIISSTVTNTAAVTTTEGYVQFGSATELWGLDWKPEDVNLTNFGCALFVANSVNIQTYSVDIVRINVFYTLDTGTTSVVTKYVMELPITNVKGGRTLSLSVPWVNDDNKVRDYGMQMLRIGRYPLGRLRQRYLMGDDNSSAAMLAAKPGKLIQYATPAAHGVNGEQADGYFRVESRALDLSLPGKIHESTITLIPSYQYRNLDAMHWDDFNRDNTATGLGTTPTGKAWGSSTQWQIVSKVAKVQTALPTSPSFDLGKSDQVIEGQFGGLGSVSYGGFLYRMNSAATAWWRVVVDNNLDVVRILRATASVETAVDTAPWTGNPATAEIRIICTGNRHMVWVNRKLIAWTTAGTYYISNSTNNTLTYVGLYARDTTQTLANFYAQGLN